MNILLIMGGWSSERDVALAGGEILLAALTTLKHHVTTFDPVDGLDALPDAVRGKDFAFISLHGSPGEDGLIQAMLESLGCPYQGSGPTGSMLALNKAVAKTFFRAAGLNTAPWCLLTQKPNAGWLPPFAFPCFIKANTGGSSLHMERIAEATSLPAALDRLFAQNDIFLVEPAISGVEITCGVLARLENGKEIPEALPPVLIKAHGEAGVFDYASKYTGGGAEEICPAPISEALTREIQNMALAAHVCLGLTGYSRADFIVPENGQPVLLEINTLPGMTRTSLIPQEAAAVGLSFENLIARLIELGLATRGPGSSAL